MQPVEGLLDEGSFVPASDALTPTDPVGFPGYLDSLEKARTQRGVDESVVSGAGTIGGVEVEHAGFHFSFLGGSMGEVAGERIARALERAAAREVPFVLRTATGGARMQEGMAGLVQMARVVVARQTLAAAGQPLIAVLGHPTTGGVLASIAALADVTIAEEGATVGFAGPRIVERFTGRRLGPGSHTAMGAFQHGLVDHVTAPSEVRALVGRTLGLLVEDTPAVAASRPADTTPRHALDAWDAVLAARADARPTAPELARDTADGYVSLHGDRAGGEDPGVLTLLAQVKGRRCMLAALDRSHAPGPAAYRKTRRCVDIAGRLGLPIVTLVDTPGANPSEGSEARGIAWEIGALFDAMLTVPVPVLSVVTGEGGSGGALAFALGDILLAYEDSIFSVIGPEAAAEILWRDSSRAPEAARLTKLTADSLLALGIADGVVRAPIDSKGLGDQVAYHLDRLAEQSLDEHERVEHRRARWRRPAR